MKKEEKARIRNNQWEAVESVTTKFYEPGELMWDHETHIPDPHFLAFLNEDEFLSSSVGRKNTITHIRYRIVEE